MPSCYAQPGITISAGHDACAQDTRPFPRDARPQPPMRDISTLGSATVSAERSSL